MYILMCICSWPSVCLFSAACGSMYFTTLANLSFCDCAQTASSLLAGLPCLCFVCSMSHLKSCLKRHSLIDVQRFCAFGLVLYLATMQGCQFLWCGESQPKQSKVNNTTFNYPSSRLQLGTSYSLYLFCICRRVCVFAFVRRSVRAVLLLRKASARVLFSVVVAWMLLDRFVLFVTWII